MKQDVCGLWNTAPALSSFHSTCMFYPGFRFECTIETPCHTGFPPTHGRNLRNIICSSSENIVSQSVPGFLSAGVGYATLMPLRLWRSLAFNKGILIHVHGMKWTWCVCLLFTRECKHKYFHLSNIQVFLTDRPDIEAWHWFTVSAFPMKFKQWFSKLVPIPWLSIAFYSCVPRSVMCPPDRLPWFVTQT